MSHKNDTRNGQNVRVIDLTEREDTYKPNDLYLTQDGFWNIG